MLCNEAEATENGRPLLGTKDSRRRANASAWLRENADPDFVVDSIRGIEMLVTIRTPSVLDRAERLLIGLGRSTQRVGQVHNLGASWEAIAWALNRYELDGIAQILQESGYIEIHPTIGSGHKPVRVTAAGWARLEEMSASNVGSTRAFVAMWFRPTLKRLYLEAIEPAIQAAGYSAHRIDSIPHVERIDDRIIAEIRRSRFIVADYTGHRGGVYYETGFAHGLGLPVFFTCCKRHMKHLHFDIRQYNCIDWRSRADLKERLVHAIVGLLGPGPLMEE